MARRRLGEVLRVLRPASLQSDFTLPLHESLVHLEAAMVWLEESRYHNRTYLSK
jgi:hypothetical protein